MKKCFILIYFFCVGIAIFAQKSSTILYVSPQYFLVNTIKLDVERNKQNSSRNSIVISPLIQIGKISKSGGAYKRADNYKNDVAGGVPQSSDQIVGLGVQLAYKTYLKGNNDLLSNHNTYFQYGFSYLYSNVSHQTGIATEDSISKNFITKSVYGVDKFNILGLQSTMGDKIELGKRCLLDFYVGIGFKYTIKSTDAKGYRNYSRHIFDYGYNGVYPVLGLKFGFKI